MFIYQSVFEIFMSIHNNLIELLHYYSTYFNNNTKSEIKFYYWLLHNETCILSAVFLKFSAVSCQWNNFRFYINSTYFPSSSIHCGERHFSEDEGLLPFYVLTFQSSPLLLLAVKKNYPFTGEQNIKTQFTNESIFLARLREPCYFVVAEDGAKGEGRELLCGCVRSGVSVAGYVDSPAAVRRLFQEVPPQLVREEPSGSRRNCKLHKQVKITNMLIPFQNILTIVLYQISQWRPIMIYVKLSFCSVQVNISGNHYWSFQKVGTRLIYWSWMFSLCQNCLM